MHRRTVITEELDDGPEIEFEFEPVDGTVLQKKVGDRFVVAYLVVDFDPINPMKEYDGQGTLYTYKAGVITDDSCAPRYLGLQEFGSHHYNPTKEYDLDGIEERVRSKLSKFIQANETLRIWFVKIRLELDCDPLPYLIEEIQSYRADVEWADVDCEMLEKLPTWETLAEEAWDELYEEGKIGDYLAVPVRYCDSCHGPGTARIYTCDIGDANAVWVPDQSCIDNMNFEGCNTYLDKLAVASKYADSVLDEYEKWCNGEVFGCVCDVYDENGDRLEDGNPNSCWGFIGYEWALQALQEEFFEPMCEHVEKEFLRDLHTQCDRQQELML